jgi:prepilin-type N-terminal cleavage/methylation domain-containing protein
MSRTYKRALTLIELLISIALLSVLVIAISLVYRVGLRTFYGQATRSDMKGEVSRALINMAGELRQANSVTGADAKSVTFTADINADGVNETIQYVWSGVSGAALNRISGSATSPLIKSMSAATFSYYDASNTLMPTSPTASLVRLVAVSATVTYRDETFNLITKIALREL